VTGPSIKGTTFQKVVDDLRELVEEGLLSFEKIEARLEAADLAYLEKKISPTEWVPIDTYERGVELLAATRAPGRREAYLVERGAQAAERLASLGIYSQLDATTENMGPRIGHMIITVARAIFNFGEWHFEPGENGGFRMRIDDAEALPEVGRFAVQGFTQYVANRASGFPVRVSSDRPSRDVVLFRADPAR
jgi:hypothetical protein